MYSDLSKFYNTNLALTSAADRRLAGPNQSYATASTRRFELWE